MATGGALDRVDPAAHVRLAPVPPGDLAWLVALPCALVALAAMMLLGPALGRVLTHAAPQDYWPVVAASALHPEPTEQGRYVLSLTAPLLASAAVLLWVRFAPAVRSGVVVRSLVRANQLLLSVIVLGLVVVVQHLHNQFGSPFVPRAYFTWRTIVVAATIAVLLVLAVRVVGPELHARLWRETRTRRVLAFTVAALVTAAWLLTGVNTDSTIGAAKLVFEEIPQAFESAFAALSGQGPLVGIHALYSHLIPYVVAGSMSIFGGTLGVYTVTMVSMTGGAMLASFAVLRRIVRESLLALALFLPFMAMSFFMIKGTLVDRMDPANLFSSFPERMGLPYVLAWLTTRHLAGSAPRRVPLLMCAAGLVLINDFAFGLAAFGATLAALIWTQRAPSRRTLARLLGATVSGLLAAAAAVSLMALTVEGSLPHFDWLVTYVRIYGSGGWAMWPMPTIGLHLVLYLTFAAAIVLATVRAIRSTEDVLLTGMLVWSGVFGLGAFAYYVGQSHPEPLISVFSAWAFAIVLLTVAVVRSIAARASRLPTLPELAVLFGFGLAACSLAQIPAPWGQIDRLQKHTATTPYTHNALERFIAADTERGDHVLLLTRLPHRLAYDLGLVDTAPYPSGIAVMPLVSQLTESLDRLRQAGGHVVFAWTTDLQGDVATALTTAGFAVTRTISDDSIQQYPGQYLELRDDRPGRALS